METIIRLKPSELTAGLLKNLQAMFRNVAEIELTIRPSEDFGLLDKESPEEYKKRLEKTIAYAEKGEGLIEFTAEEFEEYSRSLLKK